MWCVCGIGFGGARVGIDGVEGWNRWGWGNEGWRLFVGLKCGGGRGESYEVLLRVSRTSLGSSDKRGVD